MKQTTKNKGRRMQRLMLEIYDVDRDTLYRIEHGAWKNEKELDDHISYLSSLKDRRNYYKCAKDETRIPSRYKFILLNERFPSERQRHDAMNEFKNVTNKSTLSYQIEFENVKKIASLKNIENITLNPLDFGWIRRGRPDLLILEEKVENLEQGKMAYINDVIIISNRKVKFGELLIKFKLLER